MGAGYKDLFERHFFQIAQNSDCNDDDDDDEIDVYSINEGGDLYGKKGLGACRESSTLGRDFGSLSGIGIWSISESGLIEIRIKSMPGMSGVQSQRDRKMTRDNYPNLVIVAKEVK